MRQEFPPLGFTDDGDYVELDNTDVWSGLDEQLLHWDQAQQPGASRSAGRGSIGERAARQAAANQARVEELRAQYREYKQREADLAARAAEADQAAAAARARCRRNLRARSSGPRRVRTVRRPVDHAGAHACTDRDPAAATTSDPEGRDRPNATAASRAAARTARAPRGSQPPPRTPCTKDRVDQPCAPETFKVARGIVMHIEGRTWVGLSTSFAEWAEGRGHLDGPHRVEIQNSPGDVAALTGAVWTRFHTSNVTVQVNVRYEEFELECERRWPCVNGVLGPPVTQSRISRKGVKHFTVDARTYGDGASDVGRDDLVRFLHDVLKPYVQDSSDAEKYRQRCR